METKTETMDPDSPPPLKIHEDEDSSTPTRIKDESFGNEVVITTSTKLSTPVSSLSSPVIAKFKKNSNYCGTKKLPCPDLGEGWEFEQIVRQQGKSAGDFDVYYYSPDAKRLRSKLQLQKYLNDNMEDFDFNGGRRLTSEELVLGKRPAKKDALLIDKLINFDKEMWKKQTSSPIKPKRTPPPNKSILKIRTPHMAPKRMITTKKKKISPPKTISPPKPIINNISTEPPLETERHATNPMELFFLKAKSSVLMSQLNGMSTGAVSALLHTAWENLSYSARMEFINAFDTALASPSQANTEGNTTSNTEGNTTSNTEGNTTFALPNNKPFENSFHADTCNCRQCCSLRSPGFMVGKARRHRCGTCENCRRSNCGTCSNCKNMRKFGGQGSKKQSCEMRKCMNLIYRGTSEDLSPPSMVLKVDNNMVGNLPSINQHPNSRIRTYSNDDNDLAPIAKLRKISNPLPELIQPSRSMAPTKIDSHKPLLPKSTTPAQAIYIVQQNPVQPQNFTHLQMHCQPQNVIPCYQHVINTTPVQLPVVSLPTNFSTLPSDQHRFLPTMSMPNRANGVMMQHNNVPQYNRNINIATHSNNGLNNQTNHSFIPQNITVLSQATLAQNSVVMSNNSLPTITSIRRPIAVPQNHINVQPNIPLYQNGHNFNNLEKDRKHSSKLEKLCKSVNEIVNSISLNPVKQEKFNDDGIKDASLFDNSKRRRKSNNPKMFVRSSNEYDSEAFSEGNFAVNS